jgi:hypothetical protein
MKENKSMKSVLTLACVCGLCLGLGLAAEPAAAPAGVSAAPVAAEAATARQVKAKPFLEAGDKAYAAYDTKTALEQYKKAWEADPTTYETMMKYARSLNDSGEETTGKAAEALFAESVVQATALKNKYPDKAEASFLLGAATGNLALFKGGSKKVELSRNIEALGKRCIELDPKYSQGYVMLGIYYREVANLNWAIRKIAQNMLGGLPSGTLEDSEKMLRKGHELDLEAIYPCYQLAVTLECMKKKKEACECYEKVAKMKKCDHLDDAKIKEAKEKIKKLKD